MKKVIEIEDLCCKRCAERVEKHLLLAEKVSSAKANLRKRVVYVESSLADEELCALVANAGFTVREVRPRKGIFG